MGKLTDVLNKIWPWFQTTADQIEKWDASPEIKALLNQVWLTLPVKIQKLIWELVKKLAEMYGDDLAKKILKDVLEVLNRV